MAVVGRWGARAWGAQDREGAEGGAVLLGARPAGAQGELAGLMVGLLASERL